MSQQSMDVNTQSKYHNEELHHAFMAWLNAAVNLLHDKPIPVQNDVEVTLLPNGWQTQGSYRPDYTQWYYANLKELDDLKEFENIVNIVAKSPTLASTLFMVAHFVKTEKSAQLRATFLLFRYYSFCLCPAVPL
jgi:hypothetical protein